MGVVCPFYGISFLRFSPSHTLPLYTELLLLS